jgi:hypothetical protein
MMGQCRLCLRDNQTLIDGHVAPAWAYRRIMSGISQPAQPVQIQDDTAVLTNKQVTEYMLCNDCEQKLCVWEKYASTTLVQADGTFPWLVQSRDVAMALNGGDPLGYLDSSSLDTETLSRFAASVVWRASVSEEACPKVDLGHRYEESFRRYLKGEAPFPSHASLIVYLLTVPVKGLPPADRIVTLPTQMRDGPCMRHWFILCGVAFYLFVGNRIPVLHRRMCFAATKHVHTIGSDWVMADLGRAVMEAKAKGRLAEMHPDYA